MDQVEAKANAVVKAAAERKLRLTTAESCTGGRIAAAICGVAGASTVFDQGVVTYANSSKVRLLGVDASLLERYGAVSQQVASAMAQGALTASEADIAISVTGIAGPSGGSAEKPVGTVWFGVAGAGGQREVEARFDGDRTEVQVAATARALDLLIEALNAL